jgi:NAD-dependent SIR2 family protein deacetylase
VLRPGHTSLERVGLIVYSDSKNAIHKRLRGRRGAAIKHECVDCGKQAEQWSYIHGTDQQDLDNSYEPRCTKCHCKYDQWGYVKGHTRNKGTDAWLLRERNSVGQFV